MKYAIGTVVGAALLGLTKKRQGSSSKKCKVFRENSVRPLQKQLKEANIGLSSGTLNGVEICGDSMKLWTTLEDKSVQTIITSPPYFSMRDYSSSPLEIGKHKSLKEALVGEEYVSQLVEMFLNLKSKLKDNGTLVVNIDVGAGWWSNHVDHIPQLFVTRMMETGQFLKDQEFTVYKDDYRLDWNSPSRARPNSEIVYVFTKTTYNGERFRPTHKKYNQLYIDGSPPEPLGRVLHSKRARIKNWKTRKNNSGTRLFQKRFPQNPKILSRLVQTNWNHPAPMNKMLTWTLIQLFSDKGDVVLDPFSGAGNTTKAAKICGRIGIGFELEKVYSMTAVIGEEWQKAPIDAAAKMYKKSNPNNPRSNKNLLSIPTCDPNKYDPSKTMWIDGSYLNISITGSRNKSFVVDSIEELLEYANDPNLAPLVIKIYLNNNKFTTLPPEIGNLTNLKHLDLSYNKLTTLPPEIGKLTNLETLDLYRNQITTVPPEISNLTKLEVFNLNSNQLTTLPPEIGNLKNLKYLGLSGNPKFYMNPEQLHQLILNGASQYIQKAIIRANVIPTISNVRLR